MGTKVVAMCGWYDSDTVGRAAEVGAVWPVCAWRMAPASGLVSVMYKS
jgi:hypothetical protein